MSQLATRLLLYISRTSTSTAPADPLLSVIAPTATSALTYDQFVCVIQKTNNTAAATVPASVFAPVCDFSDLEMRQFCVSGRVSLSDAGPVALKQDPLEVRLNSSRIHLLDVILNDLELLHMQQQEQQQSLGLVMLGMDSLISSADLNTTVDSFTHSFHSLTHSFTHSRLFIRSLIHSFIHSSIHLFIHSFI